MSFSAYETSVEAGRPVELYHFTIGSAQYFYTSAEDQQTIAAQDYEPRQIARVETSDGPEKRDYDFQVSLPTSDDVAQLFAGVPPGVRTRLVVSKFHRDDLPTPEVVQVFDGYVHGATFAKSMKECILTARPTLASAGRTGPPRTYQALCNHFLYDPATCKVDDTNPAYRASARPVTSQVGHLLTVSGLGSYAPGWFTGGFVQALGTSDWRMILDDDGAGGLTIMIPFRNAPTSVDVFAGCNHSDDCEAKFANTLNNGAFRFVPIPNIFETGL